jgi:hypothetical protein
VNEIAFIELTGRTSNTKVLINIADISIIGDEEGGEGVILTRAGHELKVKESLEDIAGILRKVLDRVWP